jgi:hypothetical protein
MSRLRRNNCRNARQVHRLTRCYAAEVVCFSSSIASARPVPRWIDELDEGEPGGHAAEQEGAG